MANFALLTKPLCERKELRILWSIRRNWASPLRFALKASRPEFARAPFAWTTRSERRFALRFSGWVDSLQLSPRF